MLDNILLLSDSAKTFTHHLYPPETTKTYSYLYSKNQSDNQFWTNTVFFGLQYYIKRYLLGEVITKEKIDEAADLCAKHLPEGAFNSEGWHYILYKHRGRLPVLIKAVAEGTVVPRDNVLMTIENTDPNCCWLVPWLESLLELLWYPTMVATQTRELKLDLLHQLKHTKEDPSLVDFLVHDFGFNGTSSIESAALGGCAHLLSFKGTSNLAALSLARKYYGGFNELCGFPSVDDNVLSTWGQNRELEAYWSALAKFPHGAISLVSDSEEAKKVLETVAQELKLKLKQRRGMIFIRTAVGTAVERVLQVLDVLAKHFGATISKDGVKRIDGKIGVLRVDGMHYGEINTFLRTLRKKDWSPNNVIFGATGLLQKVHADKLSMAFVSTKEPVKLVLDEKLKTVQEKDPGENLLLDVFRDGQLLVETNMHEMRELAYSD